jgi:protein gp37
MMGADTKIEWADHTVNFWTGCAKVGPGCDHCYAEGWAKRSGHVAWGIGETRRRTAPATWRLPYKLDAAAKAAGRLDFVFTNSLSDFWDNRPEVGAMRADALQVMRETPNLIWLPLTKRPQNILRRGPTYGSDWPRNAAMGCTVVNQAEADRDIPHLLAGAAKYFPPFTFLSIEPMLGPIDLTPWLRDGGIGWVICGGESGGKARPMHQDWARALRDQCAAADVPFLFKQWGEWAPGTPETLGVLRHVHTFEDGERVGRWGKGMTGRTLDGVTHDARPTP